MERIIIKSPDSVSAIMVGARWEAVAKLLPGKNVAVITDRNVYRLYGKSFPDFPVFKIEPGEVSKKLSTVEKLSAWLLRNGIDRSGFILAVGGGVTCDIAGFLASVYLRGISCGYVSTTLLSQVDASTGGKTGVNLGKVKNVIGSFRQPEFVICDTTMLRTLPEDEYLSGLGELIKTGLIGDKQIFETLEKGYSSVMLRDRQLLSGLVGASVRFKASVVASDEKEKGFRRVLNFGHTFGHAIELSESIKHGFAVAAGMDIALKFSLEKKLLSRKEFNRICALLDRYGLRDIYRVPPEKVEELVLQDKKKYGDTIHFIFLKGIGVPEIVKLPVKEITAFYKKYSKEK